MTDSLCDSVLEHRSRETEFLTNVQNFSLSHARDETKNHILSSWKSHRYQNNYKWNVITRPFQTRESEIHAHNARETTPISYFQDIDFTFLTWWNATNNGCCLDSFDTLKKNWPKSLKPSRRQFWILTSLFDNDVICRFSGCDRIQGYDFSSEGNSFLKQGNK